MSCPIGTEVTTHYILPLHTRNSAGTRPCSLRQRWNVLIAYPLCENTVALRKSIQALISPIGFALAEARRCLGVRVWLRMRISFADDPSLWRNGTDRPCCNRIYQRHIFPRESGK